MDFISDARNVDPFIVDAYEVLGKETIEALNYNEKRISAAMILAERKGNKVIRLVKTLFEVGHRYTNKTIVNKLGKGHVVWRFDPLILTDKISSAS